jgi:hypothetical protein
MHVCVCVIMRPLAWATLTSDPQLWVQDANKTLQLVAPRTRALIAQGFLLDGTVTSYAHRCKGYGNSNLRFSDLGPHAQASETENSAIWTLLSKHPRESRHQDSWVREGPMQSSGAPKTAPADPPQGPQSNSGTPVLECGGRGTYQRVCGAEHRAAEQERQAGCDPGGPHRHRLGPRPSGQPPRALVVVEGCTAASGRAAPPTSRPKGPGRPGGPRPGSPARGPCAEGERAHRTEGGRREGGRQPEAGRAGGGWPAWAGGGGGRAPSAAERPVCLGAEKSHPYGRAPRPRPAPRSPPAPPFLSFSLSLFFFLWGNWELWLRPTPSGGGAGEGSGSRSAGG